MTKKKIVSLEENELKAALREQSIVLCKTESVRLGVFPEILARISRLYFKFAALKMFRFTEEAVLDFYEPVVSMWEPRDQIIEIFLKMTQHPSLVAVVEGPHAIAAMRKLAGGSPRYEVADGNVTLAGYDAQFRPILAPMGTIRGDYSACDIEIPDTNLIPVPNFIHASADAEEFARERAILRKHGILGDGDTYSYDRPEWTVLYGSE